MTTIYVSFCPGQCPDPKLTLQTSAELQSLLHLVHCPLSRACPIVSLEDYLGPKPRGGRKLICFFFYSTPFLFLCLNPNSNNVQPLGKWSDRNYPTMCSSLEIQDDISKWVIKEVSEWIRRTRYGAGCPGKMLTCQYLMSLSSGSTGVRTCFLFFASGKPVSQWASSPVSSISCCSVLAEMVQYHRCLLQLLILKNISLSLFGNLLWERSIHIKHQRHTFKAAM